MKKVKKAVGRGEVEDARRMYAKRPEYSLDHLVKERYPRFPDALADLDDALAMVHLFASLPSEKHIDPKHTTAAQRLCREWQAYVARTRALRKVRCPYAEWPCYSLPPPAPLHTHDTGGFPVSLFSYSVACARRCSCL